MASKTDDIMADQNNGSGLKNVLSGKKFRVNLLTKFALGIISITVIVFLLGAVVAMQLNKQAITQKHEQEIIGQQERLQDKMDKAKARQEANINQNMELLVLGIQVAHELLG